MNRDISPIFGKTADSLFPMTFCQSEIAHLFVTYSKILHSEVPLPIVFSLKSQEKLFFFLLHSNYLLTLAISLKQLLFKVPALACVTLLYILTDKVGSPKVNTSPEDEWRKASIHASRFWKPHPLCFPPSSRNDSCFLKFLSVGLLPFCCLLGLLATMYLFLYWNALM